MVTLLLNRGNKRTNVCVRSGTFQKGLFLITTNGNLIKLIHDVCDLWKRYKNVNKHHFKYKYAAIINCLIKMIWNRDKFACICFRLVKERAPPILPAVLSAKVDRFLRGIGLYYFTYFLPEVLLTRGLDPNKEKITESLWQVSTCIIKIFLFKSYFIFFI